MTVLDDGFGNAKLLFPNGESVVLDGISPASVTNAQLYAMGGPCFTAESLVETKSGARPIETLRVGEMIQTADNGFQSLRWIGRRDLGPTELAARPELRPVVIRKGALGNDMDLLLSQQHGVFLPELGGLIRAKNLKDHGVRGVRLAQGKRRVSYLHLMFEHHQLVFSQGIASESFFPGPRALASLPALPKRKLLTLFPQLVGVPTGGLQDALTHYGTTARSYIRRRERTGRLLH